MLRAVFVWPGLTMWAILIFFITGTAVPPLNDLTPGTHRPGVRKSRDLAADPDAVPSCPLERGGAALPVPVEFDMMDSCTLVLFGASGDLTQWMVMPAIVRLMRRGGSRRRVA